jgi:succinate dehydrogenase/fumarate reductase cytochrome b subunit
MPEADVGDWFVNAFEKLLGVFIALFVCVLFGAALLTLPKGDQGIVLSMSVLILGGIGIIIFGGMAYLAIGMYRRTERIAQMMRDMQEK